MLAVAALLIGPSAAARGEAGDRRAGRPAREHRRPPGIVVVGRAQGRRLGIQFAGGCRGLRLRRRGDAEQRFATLVRRNGKQCTKRRVRRGRSGPGPAPESIAAAPDPDRALPRQRRRRPRQPLRAGDPAHLADQPRQRRRRDQRRGRAPQRHQSEQPREPGVAGQPPHSRTAAGRTAVALRPARLRRRRDRRELGRQPDRPGQSRQRRLRDRPGRQCQPRRPRQPRRGDDLQSGRQRPDRRIDGEGNVEPDDPGRPPALDRNPPRQRHAGAQQHDWRHQIQPHRRPADLHAGIEQRRDDRKQRHRLDDRRRLRQHRLRLPLLRRPRPPPLRRQQGPRHRRRRLPGRRRRRRPDRPQRDRPGRRQPGLRASTRTTSRSPATAPTCGSPTTGSTIRATSKATSPTTPARPTSTAARRTRCSTKTT